MKLSALREVKKLSNKLSIDFCELVENIVDGSIDFEIENYRFISSDEIDAIQQEELKGDLYILGCFTDWFIADNTNLSLKVVQALQKAEAFEELGELMIDDIETLQSEYSRLDGYGHHFNHYDGNEWEVNLNGVDYYYFRGEDGYTPVKNIDYFDGKDGVTTIVHETITKTIPIDQAIFNKSISEAVDIKIGNLNIHNGNDGKDGKDGIDGENARQAIFRTNYETCELQMRYEGDRLWKILAQLPKPCEVENAK